MNSSGEPRDPRDQSIGELFRRLTSDMVLLVRQELNLFRTEMVEKGVTFGKRVGEGAGMLGAAAVTGLMALASFTAMVILLLALVMPAWCAALIVTAAYGLAAAILAVAGKRKIQDVAPPVPTETIETVKEDVEWAKTETRSVKR